jgi:hypothetical protein
MDEQEEQSIMSIRIDFGDVAVVVVPCFCDGIFDALRDCPGFRAGLRTDLVPCRSICRSRSHFVDFYRLKRIL